MSPLNEIIRDDSNDDQVYRYKQPCDIIVACVIRGFYTCNETHEIIKVKVT